MELGIERLALGREGLDPGPLERGQHVGVHVLDPVHQRRVAVLRLHAAGMRERSVEVVDGRQQLERELVHAPLLRNRGIARRPPAVVLELRPRPLGQLQILIRLSRLRLQRSNINGPIDAFGLLLLTLLDRSGGRANRGLRLPSGH